ncbi:polysaccharide biosynthesis tyrosine autokinase [Curtobacterium sp. ISL-83]|uniref:polysaccharide biosynthesis tyrosine autokinase n=1 Tax=Curtobacterium sp. ISL-83 TaxID=2819145 RepID=UPI001BEA6A0F|nr:polysaccharide biosynthesis tyrosine autokinase [Curtobacterium sp. ISL-83]MBT2502633.1 polysaccharide biosynthesis tyrosine autokinase [Curtobacterium sp. ISL-83]
MQISDFLRLMRRSWMLLVTCTLLGTAAAAVLTLQATPEYASTTKVFVSVQSPGDTTSELVQGNSAAQQKVSSYLDVVTTASVLQPVIDELGLPTDPARLATRVRAAAKLNTVVISITAEDPNPSQSARIAQAIGKSFAKVVTEDLETPTSGGPSLVRIGTVEPPRVPTSPSSPNLTLNVVLGVMVGISLGVAAVLLRNALDNRIRTQEDISDLTELPVLGGVAFDPSAARQPLVVHDDPRHPRAESFRTLRTNVQFVDLDDTVRTFTITSALPSEGKSTTAANLAIAMAESDVRVVIIDADLRRPRLGDILGIDGAAGLTDVLIGRAEVEDVIHPWGKRGLHVLPAGRIPPNPSELLGGPRMRALVEHLSREFDYVLIDTPPLLPVTDAALLARITDGALVVAASGHASRNQFRVALDALASVGSRTLGIVLTMIPRHAAGAYGYGAYYAYYGGDRSAVDNTAVPTSGGRRAASS